VSALLGMPIVQSPLATQTVYEVEPWPTKKKRRGWRVVKKQRHCAFVIGAGLGFDFWPNGRVVLHPDAMKQIAKLVL
jgi:hypothetical protein